MVATAAAASSSTATSGAAAVPLAQEVDRTLRDVGDLAEFRGLFGNIKKLRGEIHDATFVPEAERQRVLHEADEQVPNVHGMWTEAEKSMQDRLLLLQKKKTQLQNCVLDLQGQETQLKLAVEEVKREVSTAREAQRSESDASRWLKFLHRKKYQLYKNSTGVRWADGSGAKGYVSLDTVSAFDFSQLPEDMVSEALWQKIEQCAGVLVPAGAGAGNKGRGRRLSLGNHDYYNRGGAAGASRARAGSGPYQHPDFHLVPPDGMLM